MGLLGPGEPMAERYLARNAVTPNFSPLFRRRTNGTISGNTVLQESVANVVKRSRFGMGA